MEGLTANARAFWSPFCGADETRARRPPRQLRRLAPGQAYCEAVGKRLPTETEWSSPRAERGAHVPVGETHPSASHLNACGVECSGMLTTELEAIGEAAVAELARRR